MKRCLETFAITAALLCGNAPAQKLRASQYKRVHPTALSWLQQGENERCLEELGAYLEEHPQDAESTWAYALALEANGARGEAHANIERALAIGLPPARLFLEPHAFQSEMRKTVRYAALRKSFEKGLPLHGPLVGAVGPTTAKIWCRGLATAAGTRLRLTIAPTGSEESRDVEATLRLAEGEQGPTPQTHVFELEGLQASTRYRFDVHGLEGSFRTAPEAGQPTHFSFVFGGGAGYVPERERVWTTIEKSEPDFMLLLGDNVYLDVPKNPTLQRYLYHRRQSRAEWRALVSRVPTYAIWDDHDFGTNDCTSSLELTKPPWKLDVWNTFRDQWANPAYGGGADAPGVWFDFRYGDVHIVMLDGRFYRTKQDHEPHPTMLGPAQIEWLKRTLASSDATFTLLCSPVPWIYEAKGNSKDTWNGFRAERDEIFDFLRDEKIEGVVLVSADRHRSDAWRVEHEGLYSLTELNSSCLTNQHRHKRMPKAVFSYNKKNSFGRVDIDTTGEDPRLRYEVVTIDGTTVAALNLWRSELRFP